MKNHNMKHFIQYGFVVAFLCLFVLYFKWILNWGGRLFSVAYPLILGCVFAYILNILMVRLEKIYFPKSKNKLVINPEGECVWYFPWHYSSLLSFLYCIW